MRFSVYLPPAALAGARVPAALLSRRADLHRGDLHDQGGRAAGRRRARAGAGRAATPARARRASPATTSAGTSASAPASTSTPPWRPGRRPIACTATSSRSCRRCRARVSRRRRSPRHLRPLDGRPRRADAGAAPSGALCERLGVRAHRRAEPRCPGAKKRSRATSARSRRVGRMATPASSCARRTIHRTLLVDQGTRDKFLDEQLRPELLRDACAAAGPAARAAPARRLRPQLLLRRHVHRGAATPSRRGARASDRAHPVVLRSLSSTSASPSSFMTGGTYMAKRPRSPLLQPVPSLDRILRRARPRLDGASAAGFCSSALPSAIQSPAFLSDRVQSRGSAADSAARSCRRARPAPASRFASRKAMNSELPGGVFKVQGLSPACPCAWPSCCAPLPLGRSSCDPPMHAML